MMIFWDDQIQLPFNATALEIDNVALEAAWKYSFEAAVHDFITNTYLVFVYSVDQKQSSQ